jgi:hypothetical protein
MYADVRSRCTQQMYAADVASRRSAKLTMVRSAVVSTSAERATRNAPNSDLRSLLCASNLCTTVEIQLRSASVAARFVAVPCGSPRDGRAFSGAKLSRPPDGARTAAPFRSVSSIKNEAMAELGTSLLQLGRQ